MEIRHLRTFQAVADERSFTRAAARLRIAQPAVSAQIKALEQEIGTLLLHRSRHHVELTPAGTSFLAGSRQVLADLERHVHSARQAADDGAGRLAIGFIGSQSHEWMPQVLRSFRHDYPRVELSLTEMVPSEQIDALLEKRLDVGFVGPIHGPVSPGLRVECIVEEEPLVGVSIDHPFAKLESVALRRLRDEDFIFTSARNSPAYRAWLLARCRAAGFVPHVAQEVDRARTTVQYVAAGFGISIFGSHVSRLPASGVKFLRLLPLRPVIRYGVAWRSHDFSEAVRRFIAHTQGFFARGVADEARAKKPETQTMPGKKRRR